MRVFRAPGFAFWVNFENRFGSVMNPSEKYNIEHLNVNRLTPYAKNARTHTDQQIDQISESINAFGFTNPVLIDGDGGIIAGHGRVLAAKRLQMESVPCIRLTHLTVEQKKAYLIADNKIALNAGWDEDLLKLELIDLQDAGFDLSLTGFSEDELSDLLLEETEGQTDKDQAPDVPEKPVTQLGDFWLMGGHRLICGDSCSHHNIAALMRDDLADQLVTDPPYNAGYSGGPKKKRAQIKNDHMDSSGFREFLSQVFKAAEPAMKPGATFYVFYASDEAYSFISCLESAGLKVRQNLIWQKNHFVMGRKDYHYIHEPILYGWKFGAPHLWASDRKQISVLNYDKPEKSEMHPTMKPVALVEYLVGNNTKPMDVVLDLFGGSGTTLIACERLKRKARLIELDPGYCDVIVNRWQEYTGEKAILESTGKTFEETQSDRSSQVIK